MSEGLNVLEQSLHKSSNLVLKWGASGPPGERTLRELLTVDGISVWDVMAVELALYHIPNGVAERSGSRALREVLTPYLRRLKYAIWRAAPIDTSDCSRWPSGHTALFLGFTWYLARDVLQPVVDMLRRESGLTPVLLSENLTPSGEATASTHSVGRHRSAETVRAAREFAKSIRRANSILMGDDRYRRIFEDEGRQLWPLIKGGVSRAFNVHAGFYLPDTVAIARHILTAHRPAIIVSIDVADPRTRIYTLLGKALGIPTVQVQSGQVGQEAVEWRFLHDDIVAAQGDAPRDVFISHGVPSEKILVTGSPRYDGVVGATDREIGALRERFAIPRQNRIVVLASSYFTDYSGHKQTKDLAATGVLLRAMKKAVFTAAAAVPGVTLIVKPHPLENVAETRALVGDFSRISFAEPEEDIRSLTCACDAFFTFGSTATFYALVLGKPTIYPTFPGWIFTDLFIRSGAVMAPRSEKEIVAAMREIVADGGAGILRRHAAQRDEYLSSMVRDGGQGATRRIADLLNAKAQASAPARVHRNDSGL